VIGTAVAGATAERLGEETGTDRAMTTDSLLAKAEHGSISLSSETVVVMDEAGMADTERLAGLIELTERSDSKLVLVGDQAQLSPIGAGGMFGELQREIPTAELKEVHRAEREWEREAWAQVREGNAQQALAAYEQHEQLHIAETREQAAKEMVEAWNKDRETHPGDRTVMLSAWIHRVLAWWGWIWSDCRVGGGVGGVGSGFGGDVGCRGFRGSVVARVSGRGDRGVCRAEGLVVFVRGWRTAQARVGTARIASRIVVKSVCQGQRAGIRRVYWRLVRVRRAGIWKR
jgi:hypothetical protein